MKKILLLAIVIITLNFLGCARVEPYVAPKVESNWKYYYVNNQMYLRDGRDQVISYLSKYKSGLAVLNIPFEAIGIDDVYREVAPVTVVYTTRSGEYSEVSEQELIKILNTNKTFTVPISMGDNILAINITVRFILNGELKEMTKYYDIYSLNRGGATFLAD